MPSLQHDDGFPPEVPTRRMSAEQTLAAVTRIDRLAELALERLAVAPDPQAVQAACEDLESIRGLAAQVIR